MSEDVLKLLDHAVSEMQPGQIVMSENTSVYAMMASIEIGDPRVDSGMLNEAQKTQPPFDPTRLLLPDEVMLVMDDLLRCEVSAVSNIKDLCSDWSVDDMAYWLRPRFYAVYMSLRTSFERDCSTGIEQAVVCASPRRGKTDRTALACIATLCDGCDQVL